jgi:NADPH2:quinone reductase
VLHAVDVDPPAPGPGFMRIRVSAAGIGLPDVLMCRGTYPLTPRGPFTPGQEGTGIVAAVGEGVDVPIGTKVMSVSAFYLGHGAFAEECLVRADTAFPVPEGLSDAAAAGFWIPHLTGWIGLVERGQVTRGDLLAVLGASGGSGIAAVQLGKALGARVIAIVGDDERGRFCRDLGADFIVNYRDGSIADSLRRLTGRRGVDVIYDPVGGAPAEDAFTGLARYGRLLAVGFAAGRWPKIATHDMVVANTSLVVVYAGGYSRAELEAMHGSLSALVADGRLRNAVTARIPFDDLPVALQQMADREVVGKRVLVLK